MVDETHSQASNLKARRRFEAIVADAEDGVAVLEPTGVIGYANPAAEFLLGHGRSDLLGEMFGLPPAPTDHPIKVNVVSRDNTLRLVELRIERLAGGPEGTLVLWLKDITAYHRRVQDARDQVRQRDEFLAMLSHELRNPLAAIRSASVLLSCDDLESQIRRDAASILERQFEHLTRILDDLLDVTRILRGKLTINPERVELNRVLRDAVEAVAPLADQRRHCLQQDLPERRLWVWGDATRLEQIVVNLLNNAVKFTPDSGRIALTVRADGAGVEICVSDNGPGIDEELLPRVFEAFVQGPQSMERSSGGLGIGLMLVRKFVALHGGRVEVRPNAGESGVCFTVWLPLVELETEPIPVPEQPPAARLLRILLVEDYHEVRRLLKRLLQVQGHEVLEAADGLSGLSAVLEEQPDVAFIDIGLPGMNGYELARRLRQEARGPLPRLVALTGYGTPEDVQKSREAGFDDHMVKPIHFPDLCRLLESCCRADVGSLDGDAEICEQ